MVGLWSILDSEARYSELSTEGGIGRACGTYVGEQQCVEVYFEGGSGSLKESNHLVNLGVSVTVLYTLIFKK